MFLGIEIGGTKLQLGLGAGDGLLRALWRGTVELACGAEGIRAQIVAAVPELLARAGLDRSQVRGVGVGFGGPVDDVTRTVIKSHQIQGWDHFPLADWIGELLGWPAVLGNDADVAGLAEALFGAGKGLSPIFYITIGSGIGGGLILNGAIYRGCGRGAAEIGHLLVRSVASYHADHFGDTTLESMSSGWGMKELAQAIVVYAGKYSDVLRRLTNNRPEDITPRVLAEAAAAGDESARTVLDLALERLAFAIVQTITLLAPRRIVIGGGVSLLGEERLFQPLRRLVAERVFKPFAGCYDIVPAALGEEVVVHGALALARKQIS